MEELLDALLTLQFCDQVHYKFSYCINLMSSMNSLKGIFDPQKPPKRNFIVENMKKLRTMRKNSESVANEDAQTKKFNLYPHVTAKVSTHFSSSTVQKSKGGSSVEGAKQGRQNDSTNRTSIGTGLTNMQDKRSRLQDSNTNQQLCYFKSSVKHEVQGDSGSNSDICRREAYGNNKSKICDIADVSSLSPNRLASVIGGSTNHVAQERLGFSISENQVFTLPVRSLGCQTLPSDDVDRIFNEGVIKYPSTCKMERLISSHRTQNKSQRPTTCDSALQTEISEKNTQILKSTSPKRMLPLNMKGYVGQLAQNLFHSNFDKENSKELSNTMLKVVTDKDFSQGYLYDELRMKKYQDSIVPQNPLHGLRENHREESLTCSAGHVPLPETERIETLKMLHKSYEEHIKELNLLPVGTDTLKMRQRKIDLERQLNKLEEGIKVFSRPKIYVKIEM